MVDAQTICSLIYAISQAQFDVNIVVGFAAENIIATVINSVQLERNDELTKYVKNLDFGAAPEMDGRRLTMEGRAAYVSDTQPSYYVHQSSRR